MLLSSYVCFSHHFIYLSCRTAPPSSVTSDDGSPDGRWLSRNATHKGSRYGSRIPPRCISASDGAKCILDKFGAEREQPQPLSLGNKHYYGK